MDKISVITIVYNDRANIIATMESVISQSYENLEYIIIDGKSTDGTTELVLERLEQISNITKKEQSEERLYIEAIDKKTPSKTYKFLSQKDSGIYDAMNKGAAIATGKWCNFMNSGDRFYNYLVLQNVAEQAAGLNIENLAVIYGDAQIVFDDKHSKILRSAPHTKKNAHKYHHAFIHQSAFIDTEIMRRYGYDPRFKIAGDSGFFTNVFNDGFVFYRLDLPISCFDINGVSSSLSWRMFFEDCQIGFRYNKFFPVFLGLKYIFWIIPRVVVRNAIPKKFRNQARMLFGKKSH